MDGITKVRIEKLPKWVQELISAQETRIDYLTKRLQEFKRESGPTGIGVRTWDMPSKIDPLPANSIVVWGSEDDYVEVFKRPGETAVNIRASGVLASFPAFSNFIRVANVPYNWQEKMKK